MLSSFLHLWGLVSVDHSENNLQVCSLLLRRWKLLLLGTSALRCVGCLRDGRQGDPGYTGTVTFPTVDSQMYFLGKNTLFKKKKKVGGTRFTVD